MTSYPTPWEKAGKTLTAIRQLGRIQNCLRLYLQSCLFNGITAPRHATLTSDLRRNHIAPMLDSLTFRLARFQCGSSQAEGIIQMFKSSGFLPELFPNLEL